MLHGHNQKKAGKFATYCVYHPKFKAEHDQMAVNFRTQIRDDIKNHKTWAGVDDKFKAKHRLPDGSLPHQDLWELRQHKQMIDAPKCVKAKKNVSCRMCMRQGGRHAILCLLHLGSASAARVKGRRCLSMLIATGTASAAREKGRTSKRCYERYFQVLADLGERCTYVIPRALRVS